MTKKLNKNFWQVSPSLYNADDKLHFFAYWDERTGDWSLYREDKSGPIGGMTLLGYWPLTLFKTLSSHAKELSILMGSGLFASELNNRAASFTDCFGLDENGDDLESSYYYPVANLEKPCYSVSEWYHTTHSAQCHFFYGEPGGCVTYCV